MQPVTAMPVGFPSDYNDCAWLFRCNTVITWRDVFLSKQKYANKTVTSLTILNLRKGTHSIIYTAASHKGKNYTIGKPT